MSLIKGIRYKENDYYHPTPECCNLKEFAEKHGGFYLEFGPFCHLTELDISGNLQKCVEKLKQKSGCVECIKTYTKWENARGIGFIFIKN